MRGEVRRKEEESPWILYLSNSFDSLYLRTMIYGITHS